MNKKAMRSFLLDYAGRRRPGKFTRVSDNVFEHLEFKLREAARSFVDGHPTLGRTLKT